MIVTSILKSIKILNIEIMNKQNNIEIDKSKRILISIFLVIIGLVFFIFLIKDIIDKGENYSNKTGDNISKNREQSQREKNDIERKMSEKTKEERKTKRSSLYDKYEKICNSSRNSERTLDRLSGVGFYLKTTIENNGVPWADIYQMIEDNFEITITHTAYAIDPRFDMLSLSAVRDLNNEKSFLSDPNNLGF